MSKTRETSKMSKISKTHDKFKTSKTLIDNLLVLDADRGD
jgi:hypothetical protein